MAVLEPLAQVLPGLRGAEILEGIFSGDESNGGAQLRASAVFVQPPHIVVSTDQGRRLVGFDSVVPAHGIESDELFGIITSNLQRKPDANKSMELEDGVLAFRTTDRVVAMVPADAFGQLFYLICRSRVVKAAKYDSGSGRWSFESRKDFLLGSSVDDSSLVAVKHNVQRSMFVWIVESKTGVRSLHAQQHSALTGLSPARTLMTGLPECEMHAFGDSVCVVPHASSGRRQLHFWPLGPLEPLLYYASVGQVELPPSTVGQIYEYKDFFMSTILPIILESPSVDSGSELLAIGVNLVKRHLLVLSRDGTLTAIHTTASEIVTLPICRLQDLQCEGTPQVAIHQSFVVIVDAVGCNLYHVSTGDLATSRGPLSSERNLTLWQGTSGYVNLCGLWSASAGLWQIRSKSILDQAELLSKSAKDPNEGKALAAELCRKWDVPEIAGKFALDAIQALVRNQQIQPQTQGNRMIEKVAAMLPHLRQVQQSPLLLITIIGKTPVLREMLLEEIKMHYASLDETMKPTSGRDPPSLMGSGLTKKYADLAEAYSVTLLGGIDNDEEDSASVSQRVQDNIMGLLLQSGIGCAEDDGDVSEVLRVYVEQTPKDVLICVFEYLEIGNPIEDGFPEASESFCNVVDRHTRITHTLFKNTRLSWLSNTLEEAPPLIFLFDIMCQMLMQVWPKLLEAFVRFSTKTLHMGFATPSQEKTIFTRVVLVLDVPEQKQALSHACAQAYAKLFNKCGDHSRALRILIQNELWEHALMMLQQFKSAPDIYMRLFGVLCEGFRAGGRLGAYAPRIFNQATIPPTYTLQDLFDLFNTSNALTSTSMRESPLVSVESSDLTVSTLRVCLVAMLNMTSS
eukprot:m.131521 g.131521  ORF g.131521 m.131521 type:complete len:854 (+) comp29553_c0_seq1:101-2662(+)